jgi:hypothetical protein
MKAVVEQTGFKKNLMPFLEQEIMDSCIPAASR